MFQIRSILFKIKKAKKIVKRIFIIFLLLFVIKTFLSSDIFATTNSSNTSENNLEDTSSYSEQNTTDYQENDETLDKISNGNIIDETNNKNTTDDIENDYTMDKEDDEIIENTKITEETENEIKLIDPIEVESSKEKITIEDIEETWKDLSDEELNEVIANTEDNILSNFLKSLSEEELNLILKKDTMLKNKINIYSANTPEEEISSQTIERSQIYYEYLLNLNKSSNKLARATGFTTKSGFFFIQISGDGKTTKRKVSVTLSSIDLTKKQTAQFSEVAVSGFSDNHNFVITAATSQTQLTDIYYTILVLKFSYTKTAHYFAGKSYTDKVDGYRFNFNKYNLENTGESTVNNTGHNIANTTEIIDVQINAANCGIGNTDKDYTPLNATGYINLRRGYYSKLTINPNGGIHNSNSTSYTYGIKTCETIADIAPPTKEGYIFKGWTLTKGTNCKGASFDANTNKFTYCGASTSNTSASAENTCTLTANWEKIYGNIIVTKVDAEDESKKIAGAVFQIYDSNNNLIGTNTTDSNGQIVFGNLELGRYSIYEIQAPDGYELYGKKIEVKVSSNYPQINVKIPDKISFTLPSAGGKPYFVLYSFAGALVLYSIFMLKKIKISEIILYQERKNL